MGKIKQTIVQSISFIASTAGGIVIGYAFLIFLLILQDKIIFNKRMEK
jgi:hypothetical protein